MPNVGHTPPWDDPELVARVLLEGSAGGEPPAAAETAEKTMRRSA
jgi:hypothetical protein